MRNLKHIIACSKTGGAIVAATMLLTGLLSSCSMMHDDQSDCRQELRVDFRYDMNMKFADAFSSQVSRVTLYAYSTADGSLVYQKTESADDIKAHGGYMVLDGLRSGKYNIMVWAEGASRHDNSYTYGEPSSTASDISVLTSRVNRAAGERELNHDLTPLYHGLLADADLTIDGYGVKTVTVPLTKDTNVIRVVLQNASGKRLNADDFSFFIDDDNTFLAYDNSPLRDDSVTYRPWSKYDGIAGASAGNNANAAPATRADDGLDTPVSAVVAELTVDRLFVGKHPRLRVRNNLNGKTVFSIPLIDYALLVKGNYNRQMSDQEYLDRQDEYNFVFFIDDNHNWLSASVLINSWRVVLHDTDL